MSTFGRLLPRHQLGHCLQRGSDPAGSRRGTDPCLATLTHQKKKDGGARGRSESGLVGMRKKRKRMKSGDIGPNHDTRAMTTRVTQDIDASIAVGVQRVVPGAKAKAFVSLHAVEVVLQNEGKTAGSNLCSRMVPLNPGVYLSERLRPGLLKTLTLTKSGLSHCFRKAARKRLTSALTVVLFFGAREVLWPHSCKMVPKHVSHVVVKSG